MATDESRPVDPASPVKDPEQERSPELADWWVWGVRKVAGVVAAMLLAARVLCLLFIAFKVILWALTRARGELYWAAGGVAAFVGVWALAELLGRFSVERDAPRMDRYP